MWDQQSENYENVFSTCNFSREGAESDEPTIFHHKCLWWVDDLCSMKCKYVKCDEFCLKWSGHWDIKNTTWNLHKSKNRLVLTINGTVFTDLSYHGA